jgi:predicted ATPase
MPIHKLTATNFKGIGNSTNFEICPITIFIGANSSGKSTCLHALTSLAQTLKLGNSAPSLVLDDDFAQVHLGRFVEIAHSHSYNDAITLGVNIGERSIGMPYQKKNDDLPEIGDITAEYTFKSTMRTQEVYVDSARISIGDRMLSIKRGAKSPYKFSITDEKKKKRFDAAKSSNFLFQVAPPTTPNNKDEARDWFETFWLLDALQREIERELRATRYLGPFRQSPLRRYPFRGSTATEVGAQGEATITLLASEHIQSKDRVHARRINRWLNTLGLAKSVELARVGTSDLFDVSLTLHDGNKLPIADLGYGLSQVLPVLTQCSFAPKGSTLLFEQPELHLHENAAKRLANIFHETSNEKSCRVMLETHTKEIIHQFLELIKEGKLNTEDIAIYTVKRTSGASAYKRVGLEWDGEYLEVDDPWVKTIVAD